MRVVGIKRDRRKSFFRVSEALFLLCMVLSIASAQQNPTPSPMPLISGGTAKYAAVVLIAFGLLVFLVDYNILQCTTR